jgi:hypothetical protein
VVFTAGSDDGWSGGVPGIDPPDMAGAALRSTTQHAVDHARKLAFVVYEGASHCTDTHTFAWQTPGSPPEWKRQRARAMDVAVELAAHHRRQAVLQPEAS